MLKVMLKSHSLDNLGQDIQNKLLYADDLALFSETLDLNGRLEATKIMIRSNAGKVT